MIIHSEAMYPVAADEATALRSLLKQKDEEIAQLTRKLKKLEGKDARPGTNQNPKPTPFAVSNR